MKYHVVVENDPETGHFTATVPGFPSIVVDAKTEATAVKLARQAIEWAREEAASGSQRSGRPGGAPRFRAKVVTVTV